MDEKNNAAGPQDQTGQPNQPGQTPPPNSGMGGSPPPAGGSPPQNLPTNPPAGGEAPKEQNFGGPPAPEIKVRTSETDAASIGRGDESPVPESVLPPSDGKEPTFRPETQIGGDMPGGAEGEGDGVEGEGESEGQGKKKMWLWIGVAVAVIAVGVIGYFVYPLFFGADEVVPPPVVVVPPPPVVQIIPHQTLFISPGPAQSQLQLSNLLHLTILNALQTKAVENLPAGTIQEIAIQTNEGSQVAFKSFLNAFVPSVTTEQIGTWFEDDFTAFLYYDDEGVWPGYAARIRNGVNIDDARSALAALETSDLSKFYLANPGTFGEFSDGQLNGVASRYSLASEPGASFNYLFAQNYLIVSTSFTGLQTSMPLLGL